jgi:hypothetical protein
LPKDFLRRKVEQFKELVESVKGDGKVSRLKLTGNAVEFGLHVLRNSCSREKMTNGGCL